MAFCRCLDDFDDHAARWAVWAGEGFDHCDCPLVIVARNAPGQLPARYGADGLAACTGAPSAVFCLAFGCIHKVTPPVPKGTGDSFSFSFSHAAPIWQRVAHVRIARFIRFLTEATANRTANSSTGFNAFSVFAPYVAFIRKWPNEISPGARFWSSLEVKWTICCCLPRNRSTGVLVGRHGIGLAATASIASTIARSDADRALMASTARRLSWSEWVSLDASRNL